MRPPAMAAALAAWLAVCVLLAGCATPRAATQVVEVPVFTPCVQALPQRPDYEFDKLALDASDGAQVLALARDWLRSRKYQAELEAVLAGCR